jgi:hypothetical protein
MLSMRLSCEIAKIQVRVSAVTAVYAIELLTLLEHAYKLKCCWWRDVYHVDLIVREEARVGPISH